MGDQIEERCAGDVARSGGFGCEKNNYRPTGQRRLGRPLNRLLKRGQNRSIKAQLVRDGGGDDDDEK
jgi:hypothetical protein